MADMNRFTELTELLKEWLNDNCCKEAKIIISQDGTKIIIESEVYQAS